MRFQAAAVSRTPQRRRAAAARANPRLRTAWLPAGRAMVQEQPDRLAALVEELLA
ncbi:hypothetical protein LO763_03170 [Glycomyces sp. A-F 0318]|uniref:hypothetical protein n=1 Tax=Glycomyces amatae TaxID=2881355 RepID=UPI001E5C8964|nr:hypothetical protein [Glycomyces amatae]MCD0442624.1 hypothetical protein [Glycomyces amatae]